MSVKIRLRRTGKKKAPFYRIVVADSRFPRNGRFIEQVGYYNPRETPPLIKLDVEKAQKWMENGAQPTETVRVLIRKAADAAKAAAENTGEKEAPAENAAPAESAKPAEPAKAEPTAGTVKAAAEKPAQKAKTGKDAPKAKAEKAAPKAKAEKPARKAKTESPDAAKAE